MSTENSSGAGHTPGPWIAECVGTGGNYDNPIDLYEITNGHQRIAEFVIEADARLIAAARAAGLKSEE